MYGQGFNSSNWLCGFSGFIPGPFGIILTILFWGLVIFLAFKLIQYLFSLTGRGRSLGALGIVEKRYAAGEITRGEFEQIKRDISQRR